MSGLEDLLAVHIREAGLPEPVREYRFLQGRKFRADFAWEKQRVLAEVQGGTYAHMAHSTGTGIERDYEKGNLATLAGWRVLSFDRKMVESGEAVNLIQTIFKTTEEIK